VFQLSWVLDRSGCHLLLGLVRSHICITELGAKERSDCSDMRKGYHKLSVSSSGWYSDSVILQALWWCGLVAQGLLSQEVLSHSTLF